MRSALISYEHFPASDSFNCSRKGKLILNDHANTGRGGFETRPYRRNIDAKTGR